MTSFDDNARETLTASSASTLYPIARVYSSAIPTPRTDPVVVGWPSACKNGRGEYFDSFGRRPSAEFERYMNRHCRYWTFNDK